MPTLLRRAGLAVALTLMGGLAHAATPSALDQDPAAYLRFLQTSPSPQAVKARREITNGPAALARERIAAQKEDIAVFPAQLNPPLPPDDQNAAPLYEKLAALRRAKPLGLPRYAQPLDAHHTYTPEQLARVQQVVETRQDIFTLLYQAADKPQCVFARDWAQDALAPPFPQYAGLRESARELKTESILLAEQGRYAEAVTSQARGYRLAEHTASDRTLMAYLVAVAMDEITLSGMQDILTLAGPNAAVDAQVAQALTGHGARLSLADALRGEPAIADGGFTLIGRGDFVLALNTLKPGTEPIPSRSKTAPTSNEKQFYADILAAAEANYLHQMRAVIRAADTQGDAAAFALATQAAQTPTNDPVQQFTRLLWPFQYDILNDLPVRDAMSREITRAAAAVLAERAKTGTYPDALPGTFRDPYTNKPLGYRREGTDGFVVYSAGPDGKGDGGRPGDSANYAEARYRFRYPAVRVPVPKGEQ